MYDIKNPDIWFFETHPDRNSSGVPSLRPLAGQYVPAAGGGFEPVDSSLKVKANSAIRSANPIGTVFFSRTLSPVQATSGGTGGKFYDVGNNILTVVSTATSDVREAYGEYMKAVGSAPEEEDPLGVPSATAAAGAKVSLLDKLMDSFPAPTVMKHGFFVEKDVWACLLLNLELGYNTMLVGPSGCGKTELVMMLSQMIGKKLHIFDMAAKQDPIASLIGVHRFDGKSVFDRADFTNAIEEDSIILLDELPR